MTPRLSSPRASAALFIFTVSLLISWTASAEPVCVLQNKTTLREGPTASSPVTWTVPQNMPFMRVAQKGSWSQVKDLDGQTHWVASSSLTSRVSCAVVKTRAAKLRQGPGTEHPTAELEIADKYMAFKKVDRDGAWVLVQDDYKARYWVNETNIWIPMTRTHIAF